MQLSVLFDGFMKRARAAGHRPAEACEMFKQALALAACQDPAFCAAFAARMQKRAQTNAPAASTNAPAASTNAPAAPARPNVLNPTTFDGWNALSDAQQSQMATNLTPAMRQYAPELKSGPFQEGWTNSLKQTKTSDPQQLRSFLYARGPAGGQEYAAATNAFAQSLTAGQPAKPKPIPTASLQAGKNYGAFPASSARLFKAPAAPTSAP